MKVLAGMADEEEQADVSDQVILIYRIVKRICNIMR